MIGICPICGLKAELRKPTIIQYVKAGCICEDCNEFYTHLYEEWTESDPEWEEGN